MEQVNKEPMPTREPMTNFQHEVLKSVELLWYAAQNNKGRGFNPQQINHIAGYLNSLSVALMQHEKAKVAYDAMLEAYVAQHGREIFDKISGESQVMEEEVIENWCAGCGIKGHSDEDERYHDTEQVSEGEGSNAPGPGLDPPSQGSESGTLSEETSNARSQ